MQRSKHPRLTSGSRHHDHDSHKDKQNVGKKTSMASLERRLPLLKKTIYVDVTDKKRAQEINLKLRKLGATIETFISKDIHYVISSSAPSWSAAQKKCHAAVDAQSPESPLFVSTPSPHTPEAGGEKLVVQTRGQALAQLARGHRRSPSPNSVLSAAQKLGIQIISVEAAERWLNKECALHQVFRRDTANSHPQESDRKRKQKQEKCKLLKEPFVKVESTSQHYRPQYALLNMWPLINVDTASGTCPFDGKGLSIPRHAMRGDRDAEASFGTYPNRGNPGSCSATPRRSMESDGSSRLLGLPVVTAGDIRRHQEKKRKEARRRGWCECCHVKYEDIDKHIKEPCHKEFARDKQNYEKLDAVIASCSSTGDFLRNVFLQHCTRQAAVMATPVSSPGSGCYSAPSDQVLLLDIDTPQKFPYHSDFVDLNSDSRPQPRFSTPMHTPFKLAASLSDCTQDALSIMPLAVSGDRGDGPAKGASFAETSADLTAVVIRRSSARGVYASPRRRLAHHSPVQASFQNLVDYNSVLKKPKVMERSMIFRDSPIASLLCVSEKVSRLQKNFVGDGFSTLRRCLSLPIVKHSGSVLVEKDLGAGETASQRLNTTNEFTFSDFRPNMHTVPLLLLDPKRKTKLSAAGGLSFARRCLKKDFLSRLQDGANELVHNNLSASTVDIIEDAVLGKKLSSTDGTELPSALNTHGESYLSKKEELYSVSCMGSHNEAVKASLPGKKAKEFSQTGEKVVTVDLRVLNEIQFTDDCKLSCENENKCITTLSTCAKLGKLLTKDLDQSCNKQKFSCSANLIDAGNCKKPLAETNVHSLIKSAYQENSEDQSVVKETKLSLKKLGVQTEATKVSSLVTEAKSVTSKTKIPEPTEERGMVSDSNIVEPKSPGNKSSGTNQLLHKLSKKGQSEAAKPKSTVSESERAELKSPLRNARLGSDQSLEKEKYYSPWRTTRSMAAGSVSTRRPSNLISDKEEYQTPSKKIKSPTYYENNIKNTDIYKTPEREKFSTALSQHTPEKSGLMTVESIASEKQKENFYSPWRKTRSQTAQMSRSQESKDQFTCDNIPAISESLSDNTNTTARGRSSSTPSEVLGPCKDACLPRHCESDMLDCCSKEDGCQVDEAKKPAALYSVLAEKVVSQREHLSCLSSGPLRLIKTVKQLQLEEDKKDASSLPGDIFCPTSEIASVCALRRTAANRGENALTAVKRFVGDTNNDSCRQTATGSSSTFSSGAPSTPPILMCQTRLNTESSFGTIVSNVELESSKRSRKSRKSKQTDVKTKNVETSTLDDHCSSPSASIQPMLNSTPMNYSNCTKEVISAGADPNTLQDESGLSSSQIYLKLVRCSLASSDKRPTKRVRLNNSWKLLSDQSMSRLLHSDPDDVLFKGFKGDETFPSDLTFESVSEVEVTDDDEREWVIDQKALVERSPFDKISEKGVDLELATILNESFVRDHHNSELLKIEYDENICEEINSGMHKHDHSILGQTECDSSLNLPECLQIAGNYSGGKSKQQRKNIPFKSPGKLRKRDKEQLDQTPSPNRKNRKTKHACMLSPIKHDDSDGALQELIPTFSSPGKGSDSSWGDACDVYLSQSFQQQLQQTAQRLRRSPRKHPLTLSGSGTKKCCWSRSRSRSRERAGVDKPTAKRCLRRSLQKPSAFFEGDAVAGQPTHQLQEPAEEVPVDDGKLFNNKSSRKLPHLVSPLHTISANVFTTSSPGSTLTSPRRQRTTNTFMLVSQPVPFN